jgi:acyl-CoA dehydrogenase
MEQLKQKARQRGLWNLFANHHETGGLSNCEYAPLAGIMGRSKIAFEACNCSAPDIGNMVVLQQFGSREQKQMWLDPLLAGEIRSAFAMTERTVPNADVTDLTLRMQRVGNTYVISGQKWAITNAMHPRLGLFVVMGKTDLAAPLQLRQSMVLVPSDAPGIEISRNLSRFGYTDYGGHCAVRFTNVTVPASNLLGDEGMGFQIARVRLNCARIHHGMRAIGLAERALELMCARVDRSDASGKLIVPNARVGDWIAESRVELEMARLLVLRMAWLIDTFGDQSAQTEASGVKFAVPEICLRVLDRSIRVHGGDGISDEFPLAAMYAELRTVRLPGIDEAQKMSVARRELRNQRARRVARDRGDRTCLAPSDTP